MLRVAEAGGEWRTTSSRVFLVDGHPASRLGLKNLLDANDMRVVGEARDGEEILLLVEEMRPALVIFNLNLSGETESIEFCRRIKSLPEAPHILLYTAYEFAGDVSSCLLADNESYVHKRTTCEELLNAVRCTAVSEQVWLPGVQVVPPPVGCLYNELSSVS